MQDTYKHKGMRKHLINELREKGISDENVLDAFDRVPRHFFLDKIFEKQAYSNMAFRIGAEQTISHPFTVTFQTQLLEIKKTDKVLEIGTGSGFQTAVLCELGCKVFSIERQKELFVKTKPFLSKLGYRPTLKFGDGFIGWEAYGPFDKIIITCGAPHIPEMLVEQLKPGGRMIIPVGEGESQEMILILKNEDGECDIYKKGVFSFVPMLKDTNK
jgi:protein-L-isoaspartate(D-aspartate) O-methyltransferase